MFGIILGTACLFGLVRAVARRRYGHGWMGHHESMGFGRGGFGRGGFGPRFMLRQLFHRLDTTPDQEKVILGVVEKAKDAARAARREASSARADIASALRSESFDEVLLGGATAKLDVAIEAARKGLFDAFAQVHSVLDAHQRSRLADFIERGRARGARWTHEDQYGYPSITM